MTHPAHPTATRLTRADDIWIRLIVFLGGMTSIGTELAATNLIAPYFGESTFIWATVIGLTMTFLAIGYSLGGRVADTYPRAWLLYFATAIAADRGRVPAVRLAAHPAVLAGRLCRLQRRRFLRRADRRAGHARRADHVARVRHAVRDPPAPASRRGSRQHLRHHLRDFDRRLHRRELPARCSC